MSNKLVEKFVSIKDGLKVRGTIKDNCSKSKNNLCTNRNVFVKPINICKTAEISQE